MTEELKSAIRRWIEVALQSGCDTYSAADFALGRVFDGEDGLALQLEVQGDGVSDWAFAEAEMYEQPEE